MFFTQANRRVNGQIEGRAWRSSYWLAGLPDCRRSRPSGHGRELPESQAISERQAEAAALAQRQDIKRLNAGAVEILRSKGMIVN